jgi:hypothetical protein
MSVFDASMPALACLGFAALVSVSCSADSSESAGPALVDRAEGCTLVTSTTDGASCRVHWDCAEAGPRILTCAPSQAEYLCQCAEDVEEGGPDPISVSEGCGEAPFEAAAKRICGWVIK